MEPASSGPSGLEAPAAEPTADPNQALLEDFQRRLYAATPRVYFTYVLMAANVLVFVAMVVSGAGLMDPSAETLIAWGAGYGPKTLAGQWWRLLTATFVHIGLIHILLNMWVLYSIGPVAERLLGNAAFIVLYLLAGLSGSLASLAWKPAIVGAGASGAIFGLYGALLAFLLLERRCIPVQALGELWKSTAAFVAYNVFYGMVHPGIDNAAHLGGLAGGFLAGLALTRPLTLEARTGLPARSALTGVAGCLLLALGAAALPRDIGDYMNALKICSAHEKQAVEAFNRGIDLLKGQKITAPQMADLVEKDVLPRWQDMARELRSLKRLPASVQRRIDALAGYASLRAEWSQLFIKALRTNDDALMKKALEKRAAAEASLKNSGQPE